jgi:uncharacterized protein YndB with AHSA1/START domain
MTRQRSFKRLVRTRMDKTGESYTSARAALLAATEPTTNRADTSAVLATSDERIRERTGRGWEEWFDLLDDMGAADRTHREIARWVADQLGIASLGWYAQAITVSYERARGGRAVGEHSDGFTITATRTVAVPAAELYRMFTDSEARHGWLPDIALTVRTARESQSVRFDVGEGEERVNVHFDRRGDVRSTVSVEHTRLPDERAADATKTLWRQRLDALKAHLEGGEDDA